MTDLTKLTTDELKIIAFDLIRKRNLINKDLEKVELLIDYLESQKNKEDGVSN